MSDGPDRRVDDLREQLRALGYLDARVDRFVLGGAATRARPLALAARASARIGMLAGALLGPAATIGLGARLPGLVTNATDAFVLAAYLAVLSGAAAGLIVFAASLVTGFIAKRASGVAAFARRSRRAAVVAGLLVTAGSLLYLTLWWRAALSATGGELTAWTIAALALAVAISLLLGHAVAVTALAYLARLGFGPSLRPGLPLASRGALAGLGAVALAGALTLLFATAPAAAPPPDAPPLTVVSTGARVVVIAIDGLDRATVDRLRAQGRLPGFAGLLAQRTALLAPETDRDPARVWTTIATGQPADRHGVRALESRQVAGLGGRLRPQSSEWSAITTATDLLRLTRPAIASGDERLIPAFWEVAARAGLRTAVIHWWATWPAPEDLGIVVSDRAMLRIEHGGSLDGEIVPAALYDAWRSDWPARRARAATAAGRALPAGVSADTNASFLRSASLDSTIVELAQDPLIGRPDLLVVYLPGLDIIQHALFAGSESGALTASGAAERLSSLEQDDVFLDGILIDLVKAMGSDDLVALVGEPGRVTQPSSGVFAIARAGGGVSADGQPPAIDGTGLTLPSTAVGPTILHALGIPVARDLASRPALALLDAAFTRPHAVRDVSSYGSRRAANRSGTGQPLDREMIERMRSLGYVR